MLEKPMKVVGLMPAAGKATRLAPLPCSKELYPIGFHRIGADGGHRPKVVCHHLLENMRLADIRQTFVIIRRDKWDIPAYLADGASLDMNLAYAVVDLSYGIPYTVDQAYPFTKDSIVALGFPDVVFEPKDAFCHLLKHLQASGAELVLGLFPSSRPQKMDMVDIDRQGRIRGIQVKPEKTDLQFSWIIAVWTPVFSSFLHDFVQNDRKSRSSGQNGAPFEEVQMSTVIRHALRDKMPMATQVFPNGRCIDIGTPEDLVKALNLAC